MDTDTLALLREMREKGVHLQELAAALCRRTDPTGLAGRHARWIGRHLDRLIEEIDDMVQDLTHDG